MNLASNVNFFLGLQCQIRVNHWQTKSDERHRAFGQFYENMDDLIDRYVEAAMGKYERFVLDDDTKMIELNNISDIDTKAMVSTVREALIQIGTQLDTTDTDLLNIRDEMLFELNKLSYLLTLK